MVLDEIVLNLDGFISLDPAIGVRERCERFTAAQDGSRIAYGDQPESEGLWSISFNLGLDDLKHGSDAGFNNIDALLVFANDLAGELSAELTADIRFRSKPWYSGHLAFLEGQPLDLTKLHDLIITMASAPPREAEGTPQKKRWRNKP